MAEKKLFLLDAMALIYRAYFAMSKNPRFNSKGLNTSAILGFANTLLDVIQKEKPTHLVVAMDPIGPLDRTSEFSFYKANREETPEDLATSIPYIIEFIESMNIPVIAVDGFEADDVIGTLSKEADRRGFQTYMMSSDKDLGQLVTENVFLYKPARMGEKPVVMGIKEVCERFSISRTNQVADILGLWGDKVDNIPGIPGVGEKTASKLLAEYDTVENLLANVDSVKNDALREKIKLNIDSAIISKQLATIVTDMNIIFDEESFILTEPDKPRLKAFFNEMEFRRLAVRVLGENVVKIAAPVSSQPDLFSEATIEEEIVDAEYVYKNITNTPHTYTIVDTEEKRKSLISLLKQQKEFCFDTETTGLDAHFAEIVGLSFSFKTKEAYYIPMPDNYDEAQELLLEFKEVFEDISILKIGQNLKFDISILKWYGIVVKGKMFDTMLAHYLIEPDMRHGMDYLAETYLRYKPVSIESLIGKKGKNQTSMRTVELAEIAEYAAEDADITLQLKHFFAPQLTENKVSHLFETIEMPLVPVLASIEAEGVKVDMNVLKDYSSELEKDIIALDTKIQELAGEKFNIASPKQLGIILFEKMQIDPGNKKTKTKQYSTAEDVLQRLVGKHEIIQHILDFRSLSKLKSTYIDALPELINQRTGRIHTSFNQAVTATGRLSSNNPNLQNIPIRTEKGREIRKAFVPRNSDYTLVSADYSQIELRIIAALSKDDGMIEAFRQNMDIHTATAAKVYNISLDEVTKDMRRNAKMVNFGIIYGISAFGLSQRLNIPRKEAAEIISQYFLKYPGIKIYMDNCIVEAKENGYVETLCGRKRYLRDITSSNAVVRGFAERNAINAPIQGSAADMIKIAMINIYNEFERQNLKSKLILQVHDELVVDTHKSELTVVTEIVKDKMRNAMKLTVPLEVEISNGNNWLEAH